MARGTRTVMRSAGTGRFVKVEFARKHPRTTIRQRVQTARPRKKR